MKKDLITKNWSKILTLLLILIVLSYIYINLKEKEAERKISECRIIAEEYRTNEIKENPTINFFEPRYKYNKDLETCIYKGGFFSPTITEVNSDWYIKDLNTNETIIESVYVGTNNMFGVTRAEFNKKEKELFD